MRGPDEHTGRALFSYLSPEVLIAADHPLRVNQAVPAC